jgi:hypothetical protein
MTPIAHLVLTLWAGGLWTICGLAAPMAFAVLDRSAAGALAGRLFEVLAWVGAALGIVLFALLLKNERVERSSRLLIVLAILAPVMSEIALGPLMHKARAAGELGLFGLLHGIAGLLFGSACLCTLALVWKLNQAK